MVNILGFGIENYRFGSNLKKIKMVRHNFWILKVQTAYCAYQFLSKALYININDLNISGKSRMFMNRYV